jgi:uncharacterized protein
VKPLLVQVDDIRESAQPWEAPLSREELDEMLLGDHPTEFHARGPAIARARLTRMGKKVLVQAAFEVPLTGACKRCLKDVALSEEIELTLTYQPAATAREPHHARKKIEAESPSKKLDERQSSRHDRDEEGSSGSFELALADEETYSGQTIDLAPAIREQVLLAAPPSPLCSEGCKGLCAVCGQDKNLRDCGCAEEHLDPRWEALKAIRLQTSNESLKPTSKE